MSKPNLLTPDEVADYLGVTTHTLSVWRSEGRYNLPFVKVGRLVRYPEEGVLRFLEERTASRDVAPVHATRALRPGLSGRATR